MRAKNYAWVDRVLFLLGFLAGLYTFFRIAKKPKVEENYIDTDEQPHTDGDCWCHPVLFFDGEDEFSDVWVHKAPGEELPPPWVLAKAIAEAMRNEE